MKQKTISGETYVIEDDADEFREDPDTLDEHDFPAVPVIGPPIKGPIDPALNTKIVQRHRLLRRRQGD